MGEKLKKTRWYSCNVLQGGAEVRQIWGFVAGRSGFNPTQEFKVPATEPLPHGVVAKDWKTIFQKKLNIALLPVDKAFLRVVHLPVSSFEETLAMVDLQLEKISPLPVAQIAWSIHVMPHTVDNLQTVVVVIVGRNLVEELLGQLESQGYLADRIEVPMIDQLVATPITEDGAWLYPSNESGKLTALTAWWYGGVLRNLGLLHIEAGENRGEMLKEQLSQMAWAGEVEGWLSAPPNWHLVTDEANAATWQGMFQTSMGHEVELVPPLRPAEVAALTANRSAKGEKANILPAEYSERYDRQYLDLLWMRGLFAALAVYIVVTIIYLAIAGVQSFRADRVEAQVKTLGGSYTNALQMKARLQVLQDRQALKYAALDCWKTVAELLPENLTLQSMEFKGGKSLNLTGTAPAEGGLVTDFNEALRKATIKVDANSQPQQLFNRVELPTSGLNPGGATMWWKMSAELSRSEEGQ